MEVNELVKKYHNTAKSKGWHDSPRRPAEIHMLIVSEVAEATEEVRKNTPPVYQEQGGVVITPDNPLWIDGLKPDGEAVELADAVIRIFDYFGSKGWDMEEVLTLKDKYNQTRAYRHGGKTI